MSYQYWELLTQMVTEPAPDVTWVCRELVRQSEVERLFCVVRGAASLEVAAVDCDGYPLGYAEQRFRDSEFSSWVLASPANADTPSREVLVTRKVSRASKRTAILGSLQVAGDCVVTLVLENRFSGAELAALDDEAIAQWVTLAALAVRLGTPASLGDVTQSAGASHRQGGPLSHASSSAPVPGASRTSTVRPLGERDVDVDGAATSPELQEERGATLGALELENWNISRAARALGMTRHGLKKRMRRLQMIRPS